MINQAIRFSFFVLLIVLFVACNTKTEDNAQGTNNVYEQNILDTPPNINLLITKRLHPRFKHTEYCDAEDQDSVMFYLEKFSKREVFNISVKKQNNTLIVSYRIIDDCCLKFRAKASLDSLKLNLFHLKRAENPCECFCMYEFEFLFRDIDKPDKLFINKEEVQF